MTFNEIVMNSRHEEIKKYILNSNNTREKVLGRRRKRKKINSCKTQRRKKLVNEIMI
jgi:hypothetical protein